MILVTAMLAINLISLIDSLYRPIGRDGGEGEIEISMYVKSTAPSKKHS